jgi:hypothetical protein
MTLGHSGKSLAAKLGVKPGQSLLAIDARPWTPPLPERKQEQPRLTATKLKRLRGNG